MAGAFLVDLLSVYLHKSSIVESNKFGRGVIGYIRLRVSVSIITKHYPSFRFLLRRD